VQVWHAVRQSMGANNRTQSQRSHQCRYPSEDYFVRRHHQQSFLSLIHGQYYVRGALHIREVDGVSVAPLRSCKSARMQWWPHLARRADVFGLDRRGSMRYATQTFTGSQCVLMLGVLSRDSDADIFGSIEFNAKRMQKS